MEMTHIEDLIGKGKNQLTMADVQIVESCALRSRDDAEVTLRLIPSLRKTGNSPGN